MVDRDVEVLIDTTLYFDSVDWEKVEDRSTSLTDKKYVLTYFLGGCSESRSLKIKITADEHNCLIIDLLDSKT